MTRMRLSEDIIYDVICTMTFSLRGIDLLVNLRAITSSKPWEEKDDFTYKLGECLVAKLGGISSPANYQQESIILYSIT